MSVRFWGGFHLGVAYMPGAGHAIFGRNYDVPMRFNMPEACPYDLGGHLGFGGDGVVAWGMRQKYGL